MQSVNRGVFDKGRRIGSQFGQCLAYIFVANVYSCYYRSGLRGEYLGMSVA